MTGWVKVSDIGSKTADSKPAAEIRKGDRVQIKQGATWYGGTKVLTGWLLEKRGLSMKLSVIVLYSARILRAFLTYSRR